MTDLLGLRKCGAANQRRLRVVDFFAFFGRFVEFRRGAAAIQFVVTRCFPRVIFAASLLNRFGDVAGQFTLSWNYLLMIIEPSACELQQSLPIKLGDSLPVRSSTRTLGTNA
jgi:hypothetical protein